MISAPSLPYVFLISVLQLTLRKVILMVLTFVFTIILVNRFDGVLLIYSIVLLLCFDCCSYLIKLCILCCSFLGKSQADFSYKDRSCQKTFIADIHLFPTFKDPPPSSVY